MNTEQQLSDPIQADHRLYTTQEIADLFGCTRGHIYNLRSRGIGIGGVTKQIPYIKRGRRVFFDLDKVSDYFNSISEEFNG